MKTLLLFQWVSSIDLSENEQADVSIVVPRDGSWSDQEQEVLTKVGEALQGNKLDAVICVAGGWAGGNAKKGNFPIKIHLFSTKL